MSGERILVVDDDDVTRYLCQRSLAREYEVSLAENGDQALALWGKQDYDLMLLDMKMSGRNPIEVLKWVKKHRPGCPVVIITGFSSLETVTSTIKERADGYLDKPFEVAALDAAIKKCLANRTGRQDKIIQGKKILIVDGEPENLDFFRMTLKTKQAVVFEAMDGRQALDKAQKEEPDMIILEAVLPGMNGLEVCREIKKNKEHNSSPIIVITGRRIDHGYKMKAMRSGADAFLPKPIGAYALMETIEQLFKTETV